MLALRATSSTLLRSRSSAGMTRHHVLPALSSSPILPTPNSRTLKTWARKRKLRQRIQASLAAQQEPALADAMTLPLSYKTMDNTSLLVLGRMGNHSANKEILKRHIMAVDQVDYAQATEVYSKISNKNKQHMFLLSLPYQMGIVSALAAGMVSIPMVFDKSTAVWFNHAFVTVRTVVRNDGGGGCRICLLWGKFVFSHT